MKMAEFRVLDDQRWHCTRRRGWLIGAMFWSGTTLSLITAANGLCVLLDWPRAAAWVLVALTLAATLALVLFHINQRQLDRIDARMDEALKGAMGFGEKHG